MAARRSRPGHSKRAYCIQRTYLKEDIDTSKTAAGGKGTDEVTLKQSPYGMRRLAASPKISENAQWNWAEAVYQSPIATSKNIAMEIGDSSKTFSRLWSSWKVDSSEFDRSSHGGQKESTT